MKRFNSDFFSRMYSKKGLAISLIVISTTLIIACGTALYIPTESYEASSASLEDLQDGRAAYINKCGGCHSLVLPEKHTAKDWKLWVDIMEAKVKMTPQEKELILKYLTKGESS